VTQDLWADLVSGSREATAPLSELFHDNSKISRYSHGLPPAEVSRRMRDMWQSLPYDNFPAVELPPTASPSMSFTDAVLTRHTARGLRPVEIRAAMLSTLLMFAYGVTRDNMNTPFPRPFRTVPSAGALFPLELYVQVRAVDHITVGLYHFNPVRQNLRRLRDDDLTDDIASAMAQPDVAYDASILLFITAAFERSTFKYGDRGYRFALLEAGHVAQNLDLTANALALGAMNIGGFYDRELDTVLGLDGVTQSTVYMVAIGEDRGDDTAYQET
jgi:SagB-type dehydrogenase family enzyme